MNEPYCLVLSGGGAKGVYHIGVWKALQELKIEVNACIGNSIGAIISAFFAQGIGEELEQISQEISVGFILGVPDDLIDNGELKLSKGTFRTYETFYKNIRLHKGLDTSELRKLLATHIDERVIRDEGCDLGVVTYSLSDRKHREVFIEDMEDGELIDYLLASSAFPGFELPVIKGKKYIDGGVYDNVPYAMARRRGYRNIIVVDIDGIGVKRRMNFEGSRTIHIKSSIGMGGVFDFNRNFLDRFTLLGYLDTMQTFGRLKGYHYFIQPDHGIAKKFERRISNEALQLRALEYSSAVGRKADGTHAENPHQSFTQITPDYARYDRDILTLSLDSAASILGLERVKVWSCEELIEAVLCEAEKTRKEVEAVDSLSFRYIRKAVSKALKQKRDKRNLYFYYCLSKRITSNRRRGALQSLLREIKAELSLGVFILENPELLDI